MNNKFETVIGLEIHAQISSNTKMFCQCSSDAFNKEPNINTCPICMGFPGQLPVINSAAFVQGVKAALALHCEIPEHSKFDRKNYFYPDLPKGFQISQFDEPVSKNGWLDIQVNSEKKRINITRLHLEDDAGKLMHVVDGTLCDYNRSGIALMEIVSEPDIRTAQEASAYAKTIQTILRYVGASEADMEKGMMRFDASVSIRPHGITVLSPRAEIKNLNSFKSLESAIEYEIERQIELWESGKPQDKNITVGWNDEDQKTYFLRDKEGADDYRYFPEPDLPPLIATKKFVDDLRKQIPELPLDKQERYMTEYKLSEAEALLISSDIKMAQFYEEAVAISKDPKKSAAFITSILMSYLNRDNLTISETKVTAAMIGKLVNLINEGKISMNLAKGEVFDELYKNGQDPDAVIKAKGFVELDTKALDAVCEKILAANPKSVEDFKKGKQAAMQFLVGQAMKETRGQANPQLVQQILTKILTS